MFDPLVVQARTLARDNSREPIVRARAASAMAGLDPQSFVNLIAELLSDGALPSTARVELFTTFEHATYRFDAEIDKSKLPDSDSAEQWAAWQEKYGTPKKS